MKIAILIEHFNPGGGGAERSTAQIAAELRDRGHAVTVLAMQAHNADRLPGVAVEGMTRRRHAGMLSLWEFSAWSRRRLREGKFDTSLSVTTAAPAAVVQPRGGTVRETLERNIALRRSTARRAIKRTLIALTPKQQLLLRLERRTLRDPMVRRVVAVSGYVVDQLRRHYGISGERVELIPNAATMPAPTDAQRAEWRTRVRKAFGVHDGATAFVFAAMNAKLKGATPLLHAVKRVRERGLDVALLMAGHIGYGQQHLAATLGVRDVVKIVGPTERMAELYAAGDVTVLPTYYDPSSKVVIESLMMGVPAITSGYNGAGDFILNGGGRSRGRVVAEPDDVEGLAAAMAALCDPAARAACAAACAGLADELSMKRHVDRLEATLRAAAHPV